MKEVSWELWNFSISSRLWSMRTMLFMFFLRVLGESWKDRGFFGRVSCSGSMFFCGVCGGWIGEAFILYTTSRF